MANLPSIAQRLNDVEINNNAPVSSQTMRRVGSDINYLLDLVGANNGDTNPTGPLGTILQPIQNISWSTTLTNAQNNTDVTLFTFTGGGDRPLRWFKRSSGLELANALVSTDTSNLIEVSRFFTINTNSLPVLSILESIRLAPNPSTPNINNRFRVKVNGISAGTVTYSSGNIRFISSYNAEITFAPSGINTVAIRPEFTIGTINEPVSGSFSVVAT